jgi:DNA-binding CsgD family transcriptional regulator
MSRFSEEYVQLTGREREVLQLVALGRSAKEAAILLSIAPCTIERHIENVRLKTRTRNRAHMIAHVIREGLLPVSEMSKPVQLAGVG